MKTFAMIDIETMSTSPEAVILTVGAVKFDPHSTAMPHSDFYIKPDVNEQIALGRHVDDNTLKWWINQNPDVREEAFDLNDRISLKEFAEKLNEYMSGVHQIWYHGATFDMVIIENLLDQISAKRSWKFWQMRDSRTFFDVMPSDPRKDFDQGQLHNSLADARVQARAVQRVFKYLAR
jgi:hypothetical protein